MMSHNNFMTLNSQMALIGTCGEDFGVREEKYRMNIGKKIRTVMREMDRNSFRLPVSDLLKCRDFLSKIKRKMDEKHST
ncbi:uncharacterized protein Eint_110935 [Encephalitozoon intestinalis ATCC 50506]|uniref:Uncharacterized protein n=1 Tax=Encephalitozoon intestinalis (strain ATCC 50506) TaxID=876142 RepID=W8PKL9_ENCIT|nr:uncharacterized protein Eint_110935 [Encephalitozoon intestinalis ATCC 50506]AHL30170.1 hypothetical protein Eint_110935 [Encephalitozoon intestinalis ATCC 50506]UTX46451.1 hypothetical protein GPK93_11g20610 [Encephalitozoon intestinalis]